MSTVIETTYTVEKEMVEAFPITNPLQLSPYLNNPHTDNTSLPSQLESIKDKSLTLSNLTSKYEIVKPSPHLNPPTLLPYNDISLPYHSDCIKEKNGRFSGLKDINIEEYFTLSLKKAADALNISTTQLKMYCRNIGIRRWPYRSVIADIKKNNGSMST